MHKKENMGNVELATVAFGQSFQITPIQLASNRKLPDQRGKTDHAPFWSVSAKVRMAAAARKLEYPVEEGIVSEETSETVRQILEKVVSEGSGQKC